METLDEAIARHNKKVIAERIKNGMINITILEKSVKSNICNTTSSVKFCRKCGIPLPLYTTIHYCDKCTPIKGNKVIYCIVCGLKLEHKHGRTKYCYKCKIIRNIYQGIYYRYKYGKPIDRLLRKHKITFEELLNILNKQQ